MPELSTTAKMRFNTSSPVSRTERIASPSVPMGFRRRLPYFSFLRRIPPQSRSSFIGVHLADCSVDRNAANRLYCRHLRALAAALQTEMFYCWRTCNRHKRELTNFFIRTTVLSQSIFYYPAQNSSAGCRCENAEILFHALYREWLNTCSWMEDNL